MQNTQMRKHRLAFETVKGSVILLTLSNIRDEEQKEKLLFAHDTINFRMQGLKICCANELNSYSLLVGLHTPSHGCVAFNFFMACIIKDFIIVKEKIYCNRTK